MNEMTKQPLMNHGNFAGYNAMHCDKNPWDIVGICYVPMQKWEQIYDEDTAFSAGTLFPCLNLPFLGGGR